MQIIWNSRQGRQRSTNNDAAAIGSKDQIVVAIMVDASSKGENGQEFACHWAKKIIERNLSLPDCLDINQLLAILRDEQKLLRYKYLHEIASYCIMHLDIESASLRVLSCGDCLTAITQDNKPIQWIYPPHKLSHEIALREQSKLAVSIESQYLLTRSLNARRFAEPACHFAKIPLGADVLLCTDGYWFEHMEQGVDTAQLNDDASMLKIAPGKASTSIQSDTENFFKIGEEMNLIWSDKSLK
ncbi:MAG: hypothetical protein H7A06_05390 [Pseudomonadales bacterium]|nr:hypothetical protein [Pseudomonadales bacterium]